MKPFIVCGVDVELVGNDNVLSVGVSTYNLQTRQHATKLFIMPETVLPTDKHGVPVLDKSGVLSPHPIDDLGSFSQRRWDFWCQYPKDLAAQVHWPRHRGTVLSNAAMWQQIRNHVDDLTVAAARIGSRVRIVSDNLSVDVGIINEHLKQHVVPRFDGDEVTLDHQLLHVGHDRRHVVTVCAAFPQWQIRKRVIPPYDIPFVCMYFRKHRADHDALQAALMYAGYINAYPQVESIKT
jgi:hypothetical protein